MNAPAPGARRNAPGQNAEGVPHDLVLMAYVKEPYGLAGGLKLHVFSGDPLALQDFNEWWVAAPAAIPVWKKIAPESFGLRGGGYVAKFPGVADRDQAFALKGWQIAVARSAFAPSSEGEYYWADLIGLAVVNREGVVLGKVTDLLDLGPHHVFRVRGEGRPETLIPFVAAYVDKVDVAGGCITVDWGEDY
jgi:16S rRNA processing protein RimM